MSFYVNATQEETFQYVMDYFNGRHMKMQASNSPSYIRVEFGSWFALETSGNAKGEAEANIAKKNGGSYVNLNLDFGKEYLVSSAVFLPIIAVAMVIFYEMLEIPFWYSLIVLLIMLIVVLAGEGYSVSKTRKRFIKEFNMFIQSLASKKD